MGNLNFPHYDKLTELITYTYHTMDEFPGDESTLYKSIEDFSGDKNKMLLVDNMIKGFGRIAYVHLLRSVYESSTEEERLSGDVWKLSKELEIAKVLGVYPRTNTPNKIDEQLFDLQVSVEEILENERIYDRIQGYRLKSQQFGEEFSNYVNHLHDVFQFLQANKNYEGMKRLKAQVALKIRSYTRGKG